MDDDRKKFPRKNGPKPGGAQPQRRQAARRQAGVRQEAVQCWRCQEAVCKEAVRRARGSGRTCRNGSSTATPVRATARRNPRGPQGRSRQGRVPSESPTKSVSARKGTASHSPSANLSVNASQGRKNGRSGSSTGTPVRATAMRNQKGLRGRSRQGRVPTGKPYEKRERPQGDRKPYAERKPFGERKPYGERPEGAERKPYTPRPEGADRPKRAFAERPRDDGKRFEPRERQAAEASSGREGTRSFGVEKPRRPAPVLRNEEPRRCGQTTISQTAGWGRGRTRRAHRQAAGAGRHRLAPRRRGADRRRPRHGQRHASSTSPAFNVMPDDRIEVDGTAIPAIERTRLFLFHKPAGVVTTNRDPEGRKTVFDVLPTDLPRLMTIGRLDINTEGLLLLTNDGGLARVLELPATGWLRRYRVRVHGKVEEKALAGLKDGIAVDGVFYGVDRGLARPRAGHQRLADDRPARGQEPRGQEHPRRARPRRVAADPHLLRPVPARRPARRRTCWRSRAACCATSSASG